jgi:hypothetical protein
MQVAAEVAAGGEAEVAVAAEEEAEVAVAVAVAAEAGGEAPTASGSGRCGFATDARKVRTPVEEMLLRRPGLKSRIPAASTPSGSSARQLWELTDGQGR